MATDSLLPIVLTPGFLDNTHKLSSLVNLLQRSGLEPLAISPQPSDGSVGIDNLAVKLAQEIDAKLGPDQPIEFFGFSMGGLIGRYYVQELGGAKRVRRLLTLATPHRGSLTARLLPPRPALTQMYPDSEFLMELNRDLTPLTETNFKALWTPFDLSVTPASNCYLPSLPERRLFSPFHGTLLRDPIVLREVVRCLMLPVPSAST
jgi:triacylglycerol lipase